MRITGLDKLQRELDDASRALGALDGSIATLRFDPKDETSVDGAIQEMEQAIDRKIAPWRNNALVANIAAGMKKSYRAAILEKAAQA